jgi:hypothetical protein
MLSSILPISALYFEVILLNVDSFKITTSELILTQWFYNPVYFSDVF